MRCHQRSRPWATMTTPTRRSRVLFFSSVESMAPITQRIAQHNHKASGHSIASTILKLSMIQTSMRTTSTTATGANKRKKKNEIKRRDHRDGNLNIQSLAFNMRDERTTKNPPGVIVEGVDYWYLHLHPWVLKRGVQGGVVYGISDGGGSGW